MRVVLVFRGKFSDSFFYIEIADFYDIILIEIIVLRLNIMLNCLLVGLGGFAGAVFRYLISLIPIKNPGLFPVNTFIINIAGAFAIGCISFAVLKNENIDPKLLLFLKVGICGGFTTFSTFSLETAELIKNGLAVTAVAYVLLSVVLSVLAVMIPQFILK